jgi:hypothetical protein
MIPKHFFDKLKIYSFYPQKYQPQAQQLFLELRKIDLHPSFINWANVFGNWKDKLKDLGLVQETSDLELKFLGWDFEI